MYLARMEIRVSPKDLITYFKHQHPGKERDYTGTVIVDMGSTEHPPEGDIDPFAALQLASASPLLSISFSGPTRADGSENLATILDRAIVASRQPGWEGVIRDTGACAIWVDCEELFLTVLVIWYPGDSEGMFDEAGDVALLARMGLADGKGWDIIVERYETRMSREG
jgi:hypothetical protein